ncbi:unnamed protein product [Durusdinium trenchii]|uniref:Uncharacterized protein n=1 Tax=Durusdinium trenchii TaxID=1381693 RepID=A0ABP0IM29_9DINO
MTKLGRLSNHDLNHTVDIIASVLQRKPTHSAAFLVAPHLPSEKVVGGLRGERRRVEDKCDMKGLMSTLLSIKMEPPPTSKRVPMIFYAYLIVEEATSADNIFGECSLMTDRSPRASLPWTSESSYIVPVAERDSLPHAAEGSRSYSDVQETAQLLAGRDFPTSILQAVRQLYARDVVFGPDWAGILQDFDKRFGLQASAPIVAAPPPPETRKEPDVLPWDGEPETIAQLLEAYVVEAAHSDVTIRDDEYLIAHGASKWIKPEKVADLKRKGNTGLRSWSHQLECTLC